MADYRRIIRRLAVDRSVARGSRAQADAILARAQQLDPAGDFTVVEETMVVNGMPRISFKVVNRSPDAARQEFGPRGLRPLGRAAKLVKGRVL